MTSKVYIEWETPSKHNLNNTQKDKVFFLKENEVAKSGCFEVSLEISRVGKSVGSSLPEDSFLGHTKIKAYEPRRKLKSKFFKY